MRKDITVSRSYCWFTPSAGEEGFAGLGSVVMVGSEMELLHFQSAVDATAVAVAAAAVVGRIVDVALGGCGAPIIGQRS